MSTAWKRRRSEPGKLHEPEQSNPCRMILTLPVGISHNGRIVRVRCACMAEYKTNPNYYNYDHLGDALSLEDAHAIWQGHIMEKTMPKGTPGKDGDTNVAANGYHYTRVAGKWRLTHHLVMEKTLGRPLDKSEMVKFKDGDRTNLDPDNLETVIKKDKTARGRLAVIEQKIMELEAEREKLLSEINK